MKKVGRNDPCPCGSNKKYKKCCLAADTEKQPEAAVTANTDGLASSREDRWSAGLNLHPYAIAKMVEDPSPEVLSALSKREIAELKDKWFIGKVARLKTDDIVTRLRNLGLDGSPDVYLPLTEGHTSAWSIGENWQASLDSPLGMHDEDFVFLAACELWKRYCPDRPSQEMVDDWVTAGYDHDEAGKNDEAADIWSRVWDVVRQRLEQHMTTFHAADAVFKITQFFGNWIQDFTMALENASLKDREYAETGVRVVREVLERFVEENENTVLNFRCDLGRILFLAGRQEKGEAVLQDVICEHPHLAHGYVTLSDQLSFRHNKQQDISRATALLDQVLSYPVEDAAGWDLEIRLADLRAIIASNPN